MVKDFYIKQIELLYSQGEQLIAYGKGNPGETTDEVVQKLTAWTARIGELILKIYPSDSQYYQVYFKFSSKFPMNNLHSNSYQKLLEIMGILDGMKFELQNGLLDNLKGLLQAEIFADFIEIAEHLLNEGYKDASAVIIGGVLEDSLRKIAIKNGISVQNDKGKMLTIEPLNVELVKAGVYNQLIKKQITGWADLRNNAAHGNYSEYDNNQVELMINFVKNFAADYLK